MPPMVMPEMYPTLILNSIFTKDEIKALISLLNKYQRSGIGWDDWMVKNWPADVTDKWISVLSKCRENGFINPVAQGDKIIWHQILVNASQKQWVDKCSVCPVLYEACKGKTDSSHNFVACWKEDEKIPF